MLDMTESGCCETTHVAYRGDKPCKLEVILDSFNVETDEGTL